MTFLTLHCDIDSKNCGSFLVPLTSPFSLGFAPGTTGCFPVKYFVEGADGSSTSVSDNASWGNKIVLRKQEDVLRMKDFRPTVLKLLSGEWFDCGTLEDFWSVIFELNVNGLFVDT
jgi:hypothetical protein